MVHPTAHAPSTIECWNNSGIRFSENGRTNMILISNVMFLHCKHFRKDQAALYLKNAEPFSYPSLGYTIAGKTRASRSTCTTRKH